MSAAGYTRVAIEGRRWPRWWCGAFGHEPTERSARMALTRCRCGEHLVTDEAVERREGLVWRPRRWTRFVSRLP